ncbi:MAG: hypothetical protein KA105_02580 [Caulobacter sp.]|nr:hypothetical protein [Caulobacter sp.]
MSVCPSCNGVIGRDCWNPQECAEITAQMARDESAQPHGPEAAKRIEELEAEVARLKPLAAWCWKRNCDTPDQLDTFAAKWRVRTEEAEARVRKAESLRDELVGALKPYAAILTEDEDGLPDDTRVTVSFGPTTNYSLTLTDFRRAWDVLASIREG